MFQSISSGSCLACTPLSRRADARRRCCGTAARSASSRKAATPTPSAPRATRTPEVLAPLLYLLKHEARLPHRRGDQPGLRLGPRFLGDLEDRDGRAEARRARGGRDVPPLRLDRLLDRDHPPAGAAPGRDLLHLLGRRAGHASSARRPSAGCIERTTFVLPVAEASLQILGRTHAGRATSSARAATTGTTTRAPKNPAAVQRASSTPTAQKYNEYPIYPCHHMAQAVWALKAAYAKAVAAKGGAWPNDAELADAFRGLTFADADLDHHAARGRPGARGPDRRPVLLRRRASPSRCRRRWCIFPAAMVSARRSGRRAPTG